MLPATEPRQACSNCLSSTASPRLEIGPPEELRVLEEIATRSRTDTAKPGIKFIFFFDVQIFSGTEASESPLRAAELSAGTLAALFRLYKEVLQLRKDRYRPSFYWCLMETRNHKKWLHLENLRECDRLLPTSVRQRRHLS